MVITVKEAIEILKTMPQEAQLVAAQNTGGFKTIYSIHTQEVINKFSGVKLTAVVADLFCEA